MTRSARGPKRRAERTRKALPKLVRLYAEISRRDLGLPSSRKCDKGAVASVVIDTAFHEAAHAVVGAVFGEVPRLVTIERGSENLDIPGWGFVRWGPSVAADPKSVSLLLRIDPRIKREARMHAETLVMRYVAGIAVDVIRTGIDLGDHLSDDLDEGGDGGDVKSALAALVPFVRSEKRRWVQMHELAERTVRLLGRCDVKHAVENLAEALLDTPTLDGNRVHALLAPVLGIGMRGHGAAP